MSYGAVAVPSGRTTTCESRRAPPRRRAVPTTTVTPARGGLAERVEPGAVEVGGVGQRTVERRDVVPGQERLGQHQQPDVLGRPRAR